MIPQVGDLMSYSRPFDGVQYEGICLVVKVTEHIGEVIVTWFVCKKNGRHCDFLESFRLRDFNIGNDWRKLS